MCLNTDPSGTLQFFQVIHALRFQAPQTECSTIRYYLPQFLASFQPLYQFELFHKQMDFLTRVHFWTPFTALCFSTLSQYAAVC